MTDAFGSSLAAFVDKTDWRKTIHECLEDCLVSMNTSNFPNAVKRLIKAVSAHFPGFDTYDTIFEIMNALALKYVLLKKIFDSTHEQLPCFYKQVHYAELNIQYYEELFDFIKNILAEKRILLYGFKTTPHGTQKDLPGLNEE